MWPGVRGTRKYGDAMAVGSGSSPLLMHDIALGHRLVAGADEAGRDCLAGPIVAAAVCIAVARRWWGW